MSTHNLDLIFRPRRIALVGVTENPLSVGGTVLKNLVGAGYRGVVYPVHRTLEAVQGVQCHPDVSHLPKTPDLAVVCAPAEQVPGIVAECGEAGIRGLVIMSAGFREIGPEGRALEERVLAEQRRFEGMRIVGPNCLGLIVPSFGLNLTFAIGSPKPGHVAFISQSGALCTSVLDWAITQGIGFSNFISIGNMLDVDFGDLIDYFGEDERTESILLYIESLKSARKFLSATRAFARQKPMVAYKAGRFPESAQAAASHTGALASEDAVFQAVFDRAGVARVFEIGDIFNCAELVGRHRTPAGPRLGIVTNAGGPGVMATDALIARRGTLARLAPETMAALDENLPPAWSRGNPVDVLGDARPRRYAKAAEIVLGDPGVDALLAILTPQAMTNPAGTARELAEIAKKATKPVLAAWLGGASMQEGIRALAQAGVATYDTPEAAVKAFMTLVEYGRNLDALFETPRDIPVAFSLDREDLRRRFADLVPAGSRVLSERVSKQLLEAYGIPVARPEEARGADEAVAIARRIGGPVVLKILSPDITHKTDVGGVLLDLRDEAAVRAGCAKILENARAAAPRARIEGVTVQPMVSRAEGVELIVGTKQDPVFGSVILVGAGGVTAEVYQDRALGLPPLNERLARRMLESLRCWPLLSGFRGRPPVHLERLVEVLMRFSYLVADYPEIVELDVNPLLATVSGAVALDARVVIDPARLGRRPDRAYSHLALRPYPEEYVRPIVLPDGAPLTLRPIRPEDEPLWLEMLGACSPETLYARFRFQFHWRAHQVATRFCFNDYDREIAIVAELSENGARRLVGVGRLVSDPDQETVEYAVLVTDAWQNRKLGGALTDYCTEIARGWGMKRIVATTTADNARMLALFQSRGFRVSPDADGSVSVSQDLAAAVL